MPDVIAQSKRQLLKRLRAQRKAFDRHIAELEEIRRELDVLDQVYSDAVWAVDDAIAAVKAARFWGATLMVAKLRRSTRKRKRL